MLLFLKMFFGGLDIGKVVKGVAIAAVVGAIGYAVYSYVTMTKDLATTKSTLVNVTAERDAFSTSLLQERAETKRVSDLQRASKIEDKIAEPIYEERKVEVTVYRDNPAVVHVGLSTEWVRIANQAAMYPYPSR